MKKLLVLRNCWRISMLYFLLSYGSNASAATYTWVGGHPGDPTAWTVKQNWSPSDNNRPNATDDVIIPTDLPNYPVLTAATSINSVTIESGASISLSSFTLNVAGNWSNSGILNGGTGLVNFNGTGAQTFTGGTTFYNVTFASAGVVSVTAAITVNGNLTISSGTVSVIGSFVFTMKGNWINNSIFSAGATSSVIFNGTAAQSIGGTSITNFNKLVIANSSGSGVSALGIFNTTGNIDINSSKLNLAASTNSQDLGELYFDGTRQVFGTWGATGSGATNINNTYFGGTGILTVFVGESPLPIELVYFVARPDNQGVVLKWNTASELNNEKFLIERSSDGQKYTTIGEVSGHGTTTEPKSYHFMDERPAAGINYYRLKQMDYDGGFEYSPIQSVVFRKAGEILVYPTITMGELQVVLPSESSDKTTLTVYSLQGALVSEQVLDGNGINFTITLPEMPSGQYIVEVKSGALSSKTRIFKG